MTILSLYGWLFETAQTKVQQEKIVCAVSNNHPYKDKIVIQIEELHNEKLTSRQSPAL
jgi:hypothetical protein